MGLTALTASFEYDFGQQIGVAVNSGKEAAVKRTYRTALQSSLVLGLLALSWPIISAVAETSPMSSLIRTPVNCNGSMITVIQPSPGSAMPISALIGQIATSLPAQLQSTSMNWIVPQCTLGHTSAGPSIPKGMSPH